ncbi:TPA: CDP-alcohol phosphatidyltransferase, partial [Candidatus Micrarchaeota archaeon]|nr:CDP-alcohol phosphatidyltransferase [Candidatus Micrarchaeota archaeon]
MGTTVKTAVILAAGQGKRMGAETPKPLLRVAGREILYRTLSKLRALGVERFVLVTQPRFREEFEEFLSKHGFEAEIVLNPYPERGNGYSLYLAREVVDGPFFLVMGDHIYGDGFLAKAIRGKGLVVDPAPRYADRDEATKVRISGGRVVGIGKGLEDPDGYDTGFFILEPAIFEVAERLVAVEETVELSRIVEGARIPVHEVTDEFWMDVDTPEDLARVRAALVRLAVKGKGDGLVSRLLNRRISTLISRFLVERISPWTATWISFGTGLLAAGLNAISPIAGAVVYQLSSILDGVDGEIARASLRTSPEGGWLDSILDRYVDISYLLSLALVFRVPASLWPVVALALLGSVLVSYSTERYRGAFGVDMYERVPALRYLPGKRDERIFLSMVFVLAGLIEELFLVLAVVTHLRVLLTVLLGLHA